MIKFIVVVASIIAVALLLTKAIVETNKQKAASWTVTCYDGGVEILKVKATNLSHLDKGYMFVVNGHEYRATASCVVRRN